MAQRVNRRDFLKAASTASGVLASVAAFPEAVSRPAGSDGVRLSATPYTPADYPIRPKRFSEVMLEDTFWKPCVATNARVTIPFEVRKAVEAGHSPSGNVLEAAILS